MKMQLFPAEILHYAGGIDSFEKSGDAILPSRSSSFVFLSIGICKPFSTRRSSVAFSMAVA